jgi:hypothetical protein
MIAKAYMITNYDKVLEYRNACKEYGSEEEAQLNDYYPVEEKFQETDFMFDMDNVERCWKDQDGKIILDFGGEGEIWTIENSEEVWNKLKERFDR